MPLIVDKDLIKLEIIKAFERCIIKKPLLNISLRDIASEAGMSHGKLLNYFTNKEELILNYAHYSTDYLSQKCKQWFDSHDNSKYPSKLSYLNAFMEYVANGREGETRPNAITQLYVLGKYSPDIAKLVQADFDEWRSVMKQCLTHKFGDTVTDNDAEAMMIMIAGTFICHYNNALTGNINNDILGCIIKVADN